MDVPEYKILGDQTDSSVAWKDKRNGLLRSQNVQSLVQGAVGAPIDWTDDVPGILRDERKGVSHVLNSLVSMAGRPNIRGHIRQVENNEVVGQNLSEDVNKIRYIITYYDELTKPNDHKDAKLLKQFDVIRFDSTGSSNLTADVMAYFQNIVTVEQEMQDHVKLSSFLKIKKCAAILSKAVPSLSAQISSLPLTSAAYTFDDFMQNVIYQCNQLLVTEAHHYDHGHSSSNSTEIMVSPQQADKMINMTTESYRNSLKEARKLGQSSAIRSSEYEKRSRDSRQSYTPRRGRSRSNSRERRRNHGGRNGVSFSSSSVNSTVAVNYGSSDEDVDSILDESLSTWLSSK